MSKSKSQYVLIVILFLLGRLSQNYKQIKHVLNCNKNKIDNKDNENYRSASMQAIKRINSSCSCRKQVFNCRMHGSTYQHIALKHKTKKKTTELYFVPFTRCLFSLGKLVVFLNSVLVISRFDFLVMSNGSFIRRREGVIIITCQEIMMMVTQKLSWPLLCRVRSQYATSRRSHLIDVTPKGLGGG